MTPAEFHDLIWRKIPARFDPDPDFCASLQPCGCTKCSRNSGVEHKGYHKRIVGGATYMVTWHHGRGEYRSKVDFGTERIAVLFKNQWVQPEEEADWEYAINIRDFAWTTGEPSSMALMKLKLIL